MNKKLLTNALVLFAALPVLSQKTFSITVVNDYRKPKINVPIVLELKEYGMDVKECKN